MSETEIQNAPPAIVTRAAVPRKSARDVLIGRDADILADIHAPGIAATIWQRIPDPAFQTWIDSLPGDQLPELRTTVPVHLAETAVLAAFATAGTPPGAEQDTLASDVGALALIYCRIMKTQHVRIRLDVSGDVMCPKFHLDTVPARLLCTYRGNGTQYVPKVHQEDPRRIRNLRTGAVGLFRGEKWASEERCDLLHRSPVVTPEAGSRLLLAIDAAD